jgi:hypothetical protein
MHKGDNKDDDDDNIKNVLDQNLHLLPGQLLAMELQKITLMTFAHITHNVLR